MLRRQFEQATVQPFRVVKRQLLVGASDGRSSGSNSESTTGRLSFFAQLRNSRVMGDPVEPNPERCIVV